MRRLAIFTTHPIQYQAPWFRALADKMGENVRVYFTYLPAPAEQGAGFDVPFEWDIPLTEGYPFRILSPLRLGARMPHFFRRAVRGVAGELRRFRPDAALVLGWQELSLIQAAGVARRMAIPLILRGESNDLRARERWVVTLQRAFLRRFDFFLSIGKANTEFYKSRGVPESRIGTAGYFVDNARFMKSAQELASYRAQLRMRWAIPQDAVCFCFAGKLEPKKRVLDFTAAIGRAASRQPDVFGLVVGSGPEAAAARELISLHGTPVSLTGFLNQSEIPSAYAACDALVLPSDSGETWGLVVNEAMASGRPAIVSDRVGCARDLIVEGRTGAMFPLGNVDALAGLIANWARNPEQVREFGANARAHLLKGYSVENAVEATLSAVEAVLGLHACRSTC